MQAFRHSVRRICLELDRRTHCFRNINGSDAFRPLSRNRSPLCEQRMKLTEVSRLRATYERTLENHEWQYRVCEAEEITHASGLNIVDGCPPSETQGLHADELSGSEDIHFPLSMSVPTRTH